MRIVKILLCGLLLALPVLAEEAEDRQTATSLHYVSHELDTRQNKLSAGTNAALTYTDSAGNVGQRTVKSNLNGGTTDTSLPMVNAVNAGLNAKQDDIEPINDHTAVTYTGQTGQIGQKGIYQDSGTYAEQSDNLIDAKTFNAALKNGLDSEFVCTGTSPDGTCWLYQIHSKLPDGYTQLEYIQSNGTQYIDTGIKGNQDTKVEIKYQFYQASSTAGSGRIFGSRVATGNRAFVIGTNNGFASTDTDVFLQYGSQPAINSTSNIEFNTWYTIIHDRTTHSINGTNYGTAFTNESFKTPQNLKIGAFDSNGTIGYGVGRIAYCKIWNGNTLIRNMVPVAKVIDNATVYGMYDMISDTFFQSVPSGTNFAPGPSLGNNVYVPQNQ